MPAGDFRLGALPYKVCRREVGKCLTQASTHSRRPTTALASPRRGRRALGRPEAEDAVREPLLGPRDPTWPGPGGGGAPTAPSQSPPGRRRRPRLALGTPGIQAQPHVHVHCHHPTQPHGHTAGQADASPGGKNRKQWHPGSQQQLTLPGAAHHPEAWHALPGSVLTTAPRDGHPTRVPVGC